MGGGSDDETPLTVDRTKRISELYASRLVAVVSSKSSGARFIVSPALELNRIGIGRAASVACFPGAARPTEVISAARAHADLVKIFPADLLGGAGVIRQMRGPFFDVRFMMSGGASLKNVADDVSAGVAGICLGSA